MDSDNASSTNIEIIVPEMLSRSLDLLPEPYCIRAPDTRVVYANLAMLKLAGLKSNREIVGRLDYEVPSVLFENENTLKAWRDQDSNIIETRKHLAMLEIHPNAVDCPYICRKVPFYNNNNECVGAFLSVKYLEVFTPNDFVRGRLPGSLLLNKPDDFFTEKECEIIFFRLQGMSSKDIGNLLYLSPRTIENRLANMYHKAGVNHLDDFREFCETRNLHRYLPQRLVSNKRIGFSGDFDPEEPLL
ncbi:helix-turn-helix transcriptional regulator [Erwiniaceae bacterium BAC15a-03b]|uniref:Helix-turn-helix transcriptional regulator n=1 Tax=Winslowiella arboricola TaxID=2978220 RepID=A0A9J6PSX6_9GAMM|nr:PAS and helix-turn-helix domain-containing protein [Winslowiella arboricola]MCU5772401.1 helix-turn-helix transcriptional regulator [Winslowiella arboricola]MCU5779806.1 helix-turn-helix transcriptional regulator [Winslowiella arboricola]